MINRKKTLLLSAIALLGLTAFFLYPEQKPELNHPTAEAFRSYINSNFDNLQEVDSFEVDSLEFYSIGLWGRKFDGARIEFSEPTPVSYCTFVLTDKSEKDLKIITKQFKQNQKEWNYTTYELDVVADTSGKACLVLIQEK